MNARRTLYLAVVFYNTQLLRHKALRCYSSLHRTSI